MNPEGVTGLLESMTVQVLAALHETSLSGRHFNISKYRATLQTFLIYNDLT